MNRPESNLQNSTRETLLHSAGEVFGELGFKAATIRAICKRAKLNIAMVRYYFKDKKSLYHEVVRWSAYCTGEEHFPDDVTRAGGIEPEERLRRYIAIYMKRLFDEQRPAWHRQLIARELLDPSSLLDQLARETFAPHYKLLKSIVTDNIGSSSRMNVEYCAASIIGQILFYQHARSYIVRVEPNICYTPKQISKWSDHIWRFSLAALAGFSANARRKRTSKGRRK